MIMCTAGRDTLDASVWILHSSCHNVSFIDAIATSTIIIIVVVVLVVIIGVMIDSGISFKLMKTG